LHLNLPYAADQYCDLFITVHALDEPFTDFAGYQVTNKTILPHPIFADVALATRQVPNPWRKPIDGAREVRIECNSNLTFGTTRFKAKPGEAITVTLANPDVVPHNWALLTPNSLEKVGGLANKFIADPDAPLRHYVPDAPEVLVYTDIVSPNSQFSISFKVPDTPGRYPFLCTFPGHWSVMNGEMIVGY
jgi:azurin